MALLLYFALLAFSETVKAFFIPGIAYEFYNMKTGKVLGVSYDFQDDFQSPLFGGIEHKQSNVEIHRTAFFVEKSPLNATKYNVIEARQRFQLHRGDFHRLQSNGEFFNVLAFQDGRHIEDPTTYWEFIPYGAVYDEFQVLIGEYDFVMTSPGRSYPMPNPVFGQKRPPMSVVQPAPDPPDTAVWRVYESVIDFSSRSLKRNHTW